MPLVKELFDWFKSYFNNDTNFGWYIVFLLIVLWMYKEIRKSYTETKKENASLLIQTLNVYMQLKIDLMKYLDGLIDFYTLNEKISTNICTFPYPLRFIMNEWIDSKGVDEISFQKIVDKLNVEIKYLILKQDKKYDSRNEEGVTLPLINFMKGIVGPFYIPLVHTFLNVLTVLFMGMIVLIAFSGDIHDNILHISIIFNILFYVLILETVAMEIVKKRRRATVSGLIISAVFIGSSCFLFVFGPWYRGIILFILLISYAVLCLKIFKRN
ncbi:hypothetical protein HQN89_32550 [Paenibacillus frigoriresistens]|uniref:hypothetical protein n=1 Tax=Paenibacillus alginolyticus TaxID=59839 RepID=UPI001564FE96|nr:hypothetical protein [Paenibacillus frigoriresistens]NRF95570.1 hypothetical protein [Paenibacillus frigoriresistens]